MSKLKIPSMLSYSRSINPTDAVMMGVNSDTGYVEPVVVQRRTSLTPLSHFSETQNAEKNPARRRPSEGDVALLGPMVDTLMIQFSVVFNGKSIEPYSCNKQFHETRDALVEFAKVFGEKGGYEELAKRYLDQILSGAPAWRNLDMSEEIQVSVKSKKVSLETVTTDDGVISYSSKKNYQLMINDIATALQAKNRSLRLKVTIKLPMAPMTEVFPSELFVESGVTQLSYVEAGTPEGKVIKQAIIHNQKLGNAIRTIDDWYDDNAPYPLAVEPFGIDHRLNMAMRIQNNRHFYKLMTHGLIGFTNSIKKAKGADQIPGDAMFFMACLIRGGVYSAKES